MPTAIPPTVFTQITQTNSSPETIAALLNEAETTYSSTPKHSNAKRVYPFWKTCQVCSQPFPCHTKEQATRNKTCSRECRARAISGPRPHCRTPMEARAGMALVSCAVCGKDVWKPRAWLRRVQQPTCSKHCNGVLRGQDWRTHAHKGRAAWTDASAASYRAKMSGANNPAWKGGITYFKTHGNYVGVKYVRCPAAYLPMARKDGYVMEHRLFVAQAMGRPLLRTEVVHHIDHDPTNNALCNLLLFSSNQAHKLYEARGTPAPIWSLSSPSITTA